VSPTEPANPPPHYAVIIFAAGRPAITAQGPLSPETFHHQFLDHYALGGERYHPGPAWTLHGALLATDGTTVVSVPIVTWPAPDGTTRFLCQATDDGTPPALSVLASSESTLLADLAARLRPFA